MSGKNLEQEKKSLVDDSKKCHACGASMNVSFAKPDGQEVKPIVSTEPINATSRPIHQVHVCPNGCCS